MFLGIVRRSYYLTRKNKRYGTDQMEFEADYASSLLRFAIKLWTRTFRILLNYAFLTSIPKWREIFATLFDGRMADHMLCDPLVPYMERELSERTYNNRKDKGSQAAINQLIEDVYEVTQGYTRPARIIKHDIQGFFPSALWDEMYRCYKELIDKYKEEIKTEYGEGYPEFLQWLAMICIYCRPTEHCVLRTPTHFWYQKIARDKSIFASKDDRRGAPIGRLSSQHGMGMYINDIIIWLESLGFKVVCFVDDIILVVPEELHELALEITPILREKLAAKGLHLNENKFYDQPYEHGVEFLGSHIKPNRIHLNDKTVRRCMDRVKELNSVSKEKQEIILESCQASINSYTGMLKNRNGYKVIQTLKKEVMRKWGDKLEWNQRKLCVNCLPGYRHNDMLAKRYGSRKRNRLMEIKT